MQGIARGERVGIVVLTQGDAHVRLAALVAKKTPAQLGPDDFIRAGVVRQGHTLRAAASLGVADGDVVLLGYPDGGDAPYSQPLASKEITDAGSYPQQLHRRLRTAARIALGISLRKVVPTRANNLPSARQSWGPNSFRSA